MTVESACKMVESRLLLSREQFEVSHAPAERASVEGIEAWKRDLKVKNLEMRMMLVNGDKLTSERERAHEREGVGGQGQREREEEEESHLLRL